MVTPSTTLRSPTLLGALAITLLVSPNLSCGREDIGSEGQRSFPLPSSGGADTADSSIIDNSGDGDLYFEIDPEVWDDEETEQPCPKQRGEWPVAYDAIEVEVTGELMRSCSFPVHESLSVAQGWGRQSSWNLYIECLWPRYAHDNGAMGGSSGEGGEGGEAAFEPYFSTRENWGFTDGDLSIHLDSELCALLQPEDTITVIQWGDVHRN